MRKASDNRWIRHWDFIVIDLIVMQLCTALSYLVAHGLHNPYADASVRMLSIVLFFSQLIVIAFFESYDRIIRRSPSEECLAVIKFTAATVFVTMAYLFATAGMVGVPRLQFSFTLVLYMALDMIARQLNKRRILSRSHDRENKRSMVLITTADMVRTAMGKLYDRTSVRGFDIMTIVLMDEDADLESFSDLGVPVLAMGEEAIDYICHNHVDEVFILQSDNMRFPRQVFDTMMEMGIIINYSNTMLDWYTEYHRLGRYDVVTTSFRSAPAGELLIKRAFDILGGLIGCLFTGIIYLFIAPIIKRQSPGPIFFAQERVGQNGKIFKIYKFRSMYMDAEKRKAELMAQNKIQDGLMFKMDDDPRIIGSEKKDKNGKPKGIGNFIRNTSLDEFPQFFNVLKGDMSLVGTRPPTKDEWIKYDLRHRIRMSAKPGITGMWQVSGRSKITDFDQVVALDRYYIEHWSLTLDLKILIKTVWVVFRHDGAS